MIEPTEDDVLVKVKQLAHDDGSLWLWNEEEDNREPNARDRVVGDTFRGEYLKSSAQPSHRLDLAALAALDALG
jgi:hypothetical protein